MAARIARGRRGSNTLSIYGSRWDYFQEWCQEQDIDPPESATVQQFCSFLLHLYEQGTPKNGPLSSVTITSYRTSIGQTMTIRGHPDVCYSQAVTNLLGSFRRDDIAKQALQGPKVPEWNLTLVMESLMGPPYEPLRKAQLEFLTYKAVFLTLLAAGRRRDEVVHLAEDRVAWSEDGNMVTLYLLMGYIPKNPEAAEGQRLFLPMVLYSLTSLVGEDERDGLLCPLRAIKVYLRRTKKKRRNRVRLFMPFKEEDRDKEIHKNTISSYIRTVINRAYEQAPSHRTEFHGTRTHEIRAISSSLNLHVNLSYDQILRSCTWSSTTPFTSHYLRDVTDVVQGMRRLRVPYQVAGAVVRR